MRYSLQYLSALEALVPWFICGFTAAVVSYYVKNRKLIKFQLDIIKNKKLLLYYILSILGPVTWVMSLIHIGVGPSSMISQSRIFIYIFFSILFFSEKVSISKISSALIVILGIVVFSYNQNLDFNLGIIYSIITTCCYTGQKILNKVLAETIPYDSVVGTRALLVVIALTLFAYSSNQPFKLPTNTNVIWAIVIGGYFGAYLGKVYDFKALERVPLYTYGILQSVKPVILFILGCILFDELFNTQRVVASTLIIGGVLLLEVSKIKNKTP